MFESLQLLAPDAIIGLIAEYRNYPRESRVDLGIGVYRNAAGQTPVLDVVKEAERRLIESQTSKTYIGSAGSAAFNEAMRDLTFAGTVGGDRIAMLQTPGGSGSLRIAAGVILSAPFSRRGLFVQIAIAVLLVGATEGAGMALNNLAGKLPVVAPFQYLTALLPILLGLGLLIRRPRLRSRRGAAVPAGTPA